MYGSFFGGETVKEGVGVEIPAPSFQIHTYISNVAIIFRQFIDDVLHEALIFAVLHPSDGAAGQRAHSSTRQHTSHKFRMVGILRDAFREEPDQPDAKEGDAEA